MPTCQIPGCDRDALFSPICAMCGEGKLPSPEEIARNAKKPVKPFVVWIGQTQALATERQQLSALNIAGNAASGDGSLTTVQGLALHHQTTPRVNFSIWYIRLVSGVSIQVYGIGEHVGKDNSKYKIQWHDGSNKTV